MKTILILIDNLTKGGAETLLLHSLKPLSVRYQIVLVTLNSKCEFEREEIVCDQYYCLGVESKFDYIKAIRRLRRIIRNHNIDLIHTHLFYSTIVGRMAREKNIPLIYSVHSQYSNNITRLEKLLERTTMRKDHFLLAVSHFAAHDYIKLFRKKKEKAVLPNFIDDQHFETEPYVAKDKTELRLIAVGNVKEAKNYHYLIEAFKRLGGAPVSLDIFGNTGHPLFVNLKRQVDQHRLPIRFMGRCDHISGLYKNYDAFISCSSNEGFGLSVAEAMAAGRPLILSDIPVFREITYDNALFFSLKTPDSLKELIGDILERRYDLAAFSRRGVSIAQTYKKDNYMEKLINLYDQKLLTS